MALFQNFLFLLTAVSVLLLSTITSSTTAAAANSFLGSGPVDLGTTLVAVKFRHGVVLGADSRTSVGGSYVSHRWAHKIVPITDSCSVARSGSAADTQYLTNLVRYECLHRHYKYHATTTAAESRSSLMSVSQIAHWLRAAVYANAEEFSCQLIVAGCCVDDDPAAAATPRIFSIAPSGVLWEEPVYACAGSGSTYILGYMDEQLGGGGDLDYRTLDEDTAVGLCQAALELAMQRDGGSGGIIRMVVLSAAGRRELTILPKDFLHPKKPSLLHRLDNNKSKPKLLGFADPSR